ncbi:MAG: penicillin-binding protein 2 [Bacteroidia bacterium]|nr:penicillin-binding protein 2 [Bacteroidia bacterium]
MKDPLAGRADIIKWIFTLSFLGLIVQTGRLQLVDSSFKQIAEQTTVYKEVIQPARGILYDRKDIVLTYNDPIYDIMCTRNLVEKMDTSLFCELLHIDRATFDENLNKDFRSRFYSRNIPFVFLQNISRTVYARFHEHLYAFPGFDVRVRNLREYPEQCGANVIGYVSEVNQQQIDLSDGQYTSGDFIGSRGLEKQYDDKIRGRKGINLLLKDNRGRSVSSYQDGQLDSTAIPGQDIFTTLDIELQRLGEQLLSNKNGSIVAIEPSSGEILALISSPTFNPNLLTINTARSAMFDSLSNDINKPFLDRSVSAKYPPGSIFKTVVGLIALQEGTTHPSRSMTCNGRYTFGEYSWGCRPHPRPNNISIAIRYSCNTYFYQIFRGVVDQFGYHEPQKGLDRMNEYLQKFGLGSRLKVDFPFEKPGNVPTSNYYNGQYGISGWKSPTIISNGIGQGELELTTIQMANLAVIMANRGNYRIPHLIKSYKSSDREIPLEYRVNNSVDIDSSHFEPIIQGMTLAGRAASFPGVDVAGKTGTSQNPFGEDHSVYFAFAPVENPQIAIAVYVENAGFGSTVAAPIASYMIEKYINGNIAENRKPYMSYVEGITTSLTPELDEN